MEDDQGIYCIDIPYRGEPRVYRYDSLLKWRESVGRDFQRAGERRAGKANEFDALLQFAGRGRAYFSVVSEKEAARFIAQLRADGAPKLGGLCDPKEVAAELEKAIAAHEAMCIRNIIRRANRIVIGPGLLHGSTWSECGCGSQWYAVWDGARLSWCKVAIDCSGPGRSVYHGSREEFSPPIVNCGYYGEYIDVPDTPMEYMTYSDLEFPDHPLAPIAIDLQAHSDDTVDRVCKALKSGDDYFLPENMDRPCVLSSHGPVIKLLCATEKHIEAFVHHYAPRVGLVDIVITDDTVTARKSV